MSKIRDVLESKRRLLGVVLCGGRSSRMGQDKSCLPHASGGTFLQHAVERLRAVCNEVSISASPYQSIDVPLGVDRINDPVPHRGPVTGVAACLDHAQHHGFDGCLFTPVDMPDVTADDLIRLRDAWQRSPDEIVCTFDQASQRLQPLIAIYPVRKAQSLREVAASDDRSLYRWIEPQSRLRIRLTPETDRNVNSPSDL